MIYSGRHSLINLQLAGMGIMAKTVQMFVPPTAGHANRLTAHVAVMLVGEDPTVLLVLLIQNSQLNLI